MFDEGFGGLPRRLTDAAIQVSREIERDAAVRSKGRESIHRTTGRKRWFRRFLHRMRHRNAGYRCTCPSPPETGKRHTLGCEMRNEGYEVPSAS